MDDTRPFPILPGLPYRDQTGKMTYSKSGTIPWWLAVKAYRNYVKRYGTSQSLERLSERGGFGREELLLLLQPATNTETVAWRQNSDEIKI